MLSMIAASMLAAAVPSDRLSSVALAAYWYKKDERGKGDEISELAKPKRFPAFAVAGDEFLVSDPLVRERHLDRIELWFRGEKVPAKEVARIDGRGAVVLKAERPVPGIVPLAFRSGDPVEKVTWSWDDDTIVVRAAGVGTNDGVVVVADTGRVFRDGKRDTLYLDKDRNPVWLDFGARIELADGKFEYDRPEEWARLPADSYERAATAVEGRLAKAALVVVIRLDPEDKDNRSRRYSRYGDDGGKNEIDALGYAIEGRVIVPSGLGGDKISRISRVEAAFPDGSTTNLVFAGALSEWDAMLFDVPEEFRGKVEPLSVAKGAAEGFDNRVAWAVEVENENGRVVATATRCRFRGVDFVRGAQFVPHVADSDGDSVRWRSRRSEPREPLVLDAGGNVAVFPLGRRYSSSRWSREEGEAVSAGDLSRFLAGEGCNPEFAPRREEDRGRFAWLGAETVRLTDALAREKKAQSFMKEYSRPPYVTEIYPGSPAAKAGLAVGDVLLAVRRGNEGERELDSEYDYSLRDWGAYFESDSSYTPSATPWPDVENSLNTLMSSFGAGARVTVVYARDGVRREAPVVLEAAPVHYKNAGKARNRALGLSVRDMTFEVRRYFKFDDRAPGIVIARVKPGSPAAVAGLKPYELVTSVNGESVSGAKDFAEKVKGRKDLVFSVRRLAQTRMVKLHVEPEADAEKDKEKDK